MQAKVTIHLHGQDTPFETDNGLYIALDQNNKEHVRVMAHGTGKRHNREAENILSLPCSAGISYPSTNSE